MFYSKKDTNEVEDLEEPGLPDQDEEQLLGNIDMQILEDNEVSENDESKIEKIPKVTKDSKRNASNNTSKEDK